jgi:hypothetical protein
LKAQHDVPSGDASRHQLLSEASVGTVILDPHLIIPNVDVNDRPMDTAVAVPPNLNNLIVIAFAIYDGFCPDFSISRLVAGIFLDKTANDFAIAVYWIHLITFC